MLQSLAASRKDSTCFARSWRLRVLIALFWSCVAFGSPAYAQAGQSKGTFSFPGDTDQVRSNAGQFWAGYKQSSGSEDGYSFVISDRLGKIIVQRSFMRSVEGAWSPDSANLYVNDFLGSTQIDCLVLSCNI